MAYLYSDFGHDGCSCIMKIPDLCIVCGSPCNKDGELCDYHYDIAEMERKEDEQLYMIDKLDDLGNFITSL